ESYVPEELEHFLRSKGIVHGLLHDSIRLACQNPVLYMHQKIEVAKGNPPGKGIDGTIVFVNFANKQEHHEGEEQKREIIDFKQVTKIDNVVRGQLIAQLSPPKAGTPGLNLYGETIEGNFGKPARF